MSIETTDVQTVAEQDEQAVRTSTLPITPDVVPLSQVIAAIARDARVESARYNDEVDVPHGGE